MKKAPCVSTDQSETQEAQTTPRGSKSLYHGPLPEIKEEIDRMRKKDNIDRFVERINRCENPRATLAALYVFMSAVQGKLDTATPETVKGLLEDQEKEVSA